MKVILGIEIGDECLKIAVAQHKGMQVRLLKFISKYINYSKEDEIKKEILNVIRKNRYKPTSVIICLPRNLVTVRNLHLPSQDKEEIINMISLHVDRIVPYKKEDVLFSYEFSGEDDMGYSRVMLAIIHKDIIRRQVSLVESIDLPIDVITLSSYGVWQWIARKYSSKIKQNDLYVILDINYNFADFMIFNKSNLLFTRSITIKGEEIEYQFGQKKLLGEIRQSLLIFSNEDINVKPTRMFLSGKFKPVFAEIISDELDISVESLPSNSLKDELRLSKDNIVDCGSPIGLSDLVLKETDQKCSFILPEIQLRKSLREKVRDLIFLGTSIMCLLGLFGLMFFSKINNQEVYLKDLKFKSYQIENNIGELIYQVDKISIVKQYLRKRNIHLFILYQLQNLITPEIFIKFIDIDEKLVILRGQALTRSDIFSFKTSIESMEYFKDIETKYANQKHVNNRDIIEFELSLILDI